MDQKFLYAAIAFASIGVLKGTVINIPGLPADLNLMMVISAFLLASLSYVRYCGLDNSSRAMVRVCDWGFYYHDGDGVVCEKWANCQDFAVVTVGRHEFIAFNSSVKKGAKARELFKQTGYNSMITLVFDKPAQSILDQMRLLQLRYLAPANSNVFKGVPMFNSARKMASV